MKRIDPDVKLIADILDAQMHAIGRGRLAWIAGKLGMTLSAARKRSRAKGFGLDAPSIRAVLLILATKQERHPRVSEKTIRSGKYEIELHRIDGETVPAWRQV